MLERRSLRSHTFCTSCFLSAAVCGLALISATSAFAQYDAVGDEILVAALDSPSKFWEKQVATSHGGGFVVAATVHLHGIDNRYFQWGRQYSSSGFPIGDPFDISEIDLELGNGNLSLDMAPGGAFVAAWTNTDVWPRVRVRRFSALASPLGPEIAVEDAWNSRVPVAMADSGAFVIAYYDGGPDHDYIAAHIFDANGDPLVGPIVVDTYGLDMNVFAQDVAANPIGSFVVVWTSLGSPGSDDDEESIQARCFTASGFPLGDQFQVNTTIEGRQFDAKAGMADSGAFVVVWESESSPGSDDSEKSVQMRRYSSACLPLGTQQQVNTFVNGHQRDPDVTVGPNGSSVVVWESYGSPGDDQDGYSIQARRYGAAGQSIGEQYQVNVTTLGDQFDPAVSGNPDANYVVVWEHEEESLMARPLVGPTFIFSDGFATGDCFSWSFVQQ